MAYVNWYQGARYQLHGTPRALFDGLHARFQFTLDGAASGHNRLLPRASTPSKPRSWTGERVFCNPPWGDIRPFVELAPKAELAVLLVPARCNARWFHRALELGARVEFFLGKPKFVGNKHTSPVDCVFLVFGGSSAL